MFIEYNLFAKSLHICQNSRWNSKTWKSIFSGKTYTYIHIWHSWIEIYVCPNRYCTVKYCTPSKILGEMSVCILRQSDICISPQILAGLQCSTLLHLWGHTYFYSIVWIIMHIIGFKTKNHVFQCFKISPLILANMQIFCK